MSECELFPSPKGHSLLQAVGVVTYQRSTSSEPASAVHGFDNRDRLWTSLSKFECAPFVHMPDPQAMNLPLFVVYFRDLDEGK